MIYSIIKHFVYVIVFTLQQRPRPLMKRCDHDIVDFILHLLNTCLMKWIQHFPSFVILNTRHQFRRRWIDFRFCAITIYTDLHGSVAHVAAVDTGTPATILFRRVGALL